MGVESEAMGGRGEEEGKLISTFLPSNFHHPLLPFLLYLLPLDSKPPKMAPRTLLSLNQDVLSEILSYLLLDTPRELNRTSILRTCSSLHLLGLPLLYRVVDLLGYGTRLQLEKHWRSLFGEGGVLTVEGRNPEAGRGVRELRIGGETSTDRTLDGWSE